ncbi:MAG: DUF4329 domain-containing protein [Saprospiraceae bacterium]
MSRCKRSRADCGLFVVFEHVGPAGAMIGSLNTKDENGNPITLYTLGSTIRGDDNTVDVLDSKTLPGWERAHAVHTHPGKGNVDSDELFSDRQNNFGLDSDKELARGNNLKFYLATPRGMLKMYDPSTDFESLITTGVPGRGAVDVIESGTFKDTHGRIRKKYDLIYKKIKAPMLNDTIEKK